MFQHTIILREIKKKDAFESGNDNVLNEKLKFVISSGIKLSLKMGCGEEINDTLWIRGNYSL